MTSTLGMHFPSKCEANNKEDQTTVLPPAEGAWHFSDSRAFYHNRC